VAVNAGVPGGIIITNQATLDPTAPNLNPIPSNPVETPVGPELAVVKTQSPMGPVAVGDHVVYDDGQ
jgi:hypothetical protein